ncbi:ATP-binding protein [Streptomyces xiamenensis]|uniref:ATP-binding protein n=1 Tax=Streptomyces sp. NRRL F-2890 TaxID=1463845 RepID=UPI000996EBBD|nr:ATP-binding protein [Streptomyces sp. NRRL F-2890]
MSPEPQQPAVPAQNATCAGIPRLAPIPFAEPWRYELHFPRDPRAPRIARLTLRTVLHAHGLTELTDRAELLTSELACNAVCHTGGAASVQLHWRHPVLRVSVWDTSPALPDTPGTPRPAPPPDSHNGRGLLLLDALADHWGGCALEDGPWGPGGKTVWFELRLTPPEPAALAA